MCRMRALPVSTGKSSAVHALRVALSGLSLMALTGCMHVSNPFEGLATGAACQPMDNPDRPEQRACEFTASITPEKPGDEIQEVYDEAVGPAQQTKAAFRPMPAPAAPASAAGPASVAAPGKSGVPRAAPIVHRGPLTLADAVAYGVMTFPEIRVNEERIREAKAGVDVARAGLYPTLDLRVAVGENFSGAYQGKAIPYSKASNALDKRLDGGLVLRQLVYDFGATRFDIERASLLKDAERFKLQEKIDETAGKISQLFVRIHEQRALLKLVDETMASHRELLGIVTAQQKEGQGTSADVSRVKSRLVDVGAIRADISLQLLAAEDQFERLTRNRPVRLGAIPNYRGKIPMTPDMAIDRVLRKNPRLAAMEASRKSSEKELESQRASILPHFGVEMDTESKNYRNPRTGRTELEGRALLAMRYRILDGGLSKAAEAQIEARLRGAEMALLNEREQAEADIRQGYRAIDSAHRKMRLISEGVNSSQSVRALYLEQFKAGRRTIFELLDGQMAYYTARRSQIESQYDALRAVFDILRTTGELTRTLAQIEQPLPVPPPKAPKIATKVAAK